MNCLRNTENTCLNSNTMRFKGFLTISLALAFALSACGINPSEDSASPSPEPVSPTNGVLPAPMTSTVSPSQDWWHPTVGLTWQWQIGDNDIDTSIEADVYDVDLYIDQSIIDELHTKERKVICYISVGSWEDWRPDKDQFPSEVLGKDYDGWPGEKWLDIRQIDKLAPIMLARLDLCKAKGFDALEPDNMEIYINNTGFPLTYDDQLKYALWLADEAHKRGLAIGIKNASDQVKEAGGKQHPAAGGSSGAEPIDDHADIFHPLPGDGERIGQGGEDDHSRAMLIVMHDRNIQGAF